MIANLKVLSFNIHKGMGWGRRKLTLPQIKIHIHDLHPDIIFLQEIRGSQFKFLNSKIWPHFSYGKNAVYQKGNHGNAIISKFPIDFTVNIDLTTRRYERRGMLHAIVKLPHHHKNLHLLCVHLGLLAKDRHKQLEMMVNYIRDNIPLTEPIILGGDFNDWKCYASKPLTKKLGLHEAFLHAHKSYAKTFPAWMPLLKLDRIYYRGLEVNAANRLNHKPWRSLSDHLAIVASLKISHI